MHLSLCDGVLTQRLMVRRTVIESKGAARPKKRQQGSAGSGYRDGRHGVAHSDVPKPSYVSSPKRRSGPDMMVVLLRCSHERPLEDAGVRE